MFFSVVFCLVLVFGSIEALQNMELPQDILRNSYIIQNNVHGEQIVRRDTRSISTTLGPYSTYVGTTNGHTCYVCRPGFYMTGDCSVNMTVGECQKCPSGTYNSNYNKASHCADCATYCVDRNAEIVAQCNATADMACHCKGGYYNHSKGHGEWICLPHTQCEPGTEPSQQGTADVDTKCQQCSKGSYSPSKSSTDSCIPCSVCDPGQVTQKVCNELEDTVCASKVSVQTNLFLKIGLPIIVIGVVAGIVLLVILGEKKHLKRFFNKCRRESQTTESTSITENGQVNFSRISQEVTSGDVSANQQTYRAQPMIDDIIQEQNWTTVFRIILKYMDKKGWKYFIRSLFSNLETTSEIENRMVTICYDNQGMDEQIYQSLNSWLKRAGDEAYLDDIITALSNNNMYGLADDLKNKFSSLLRPSSSETSSTEV